LIRLRAESLSKRFKSGESPVSAVVDVSLTVQAGESLAITGASGSGKSTLLSLLAGLERPDLGRVLVEGQDLTAMDESQLALFRGRRMGIVFQSFRLLPQLSALENVRLPLDLAGSEKADERAQRWLEEVGLQGRGTHLPAQLSGGEQQRTALARALAVEPAVLLADEPTGNLDTKNGALVEKLIFQMAKAQGAALILVTHDARLARKAHRVLAMKDGKLAKK
jgi:putative ABC transport system ATP-binding protein